MSVYLICLLPGALNARRMHPLDLLELELWMFLICPVGAKELNKCPLKE